VDQIVAKVGEGDNVKKTLEIALLGYIFRQPPKKAQTVSTGHSPDVFSEPMASKDDAVFDCDAHVTGQFPTLTGLLIGGIPAYLMSSCDVASQFVHHPILLH
jgi:hypothetical protein